MRVLHVHAGNIYGGIEAMLMTHVRQQSLCPDLETSFALCFAGRFSEELAAVGATVYPLSPVRIRQPLSIRRARKYLMSLLGRENFDVVVTHSCWSQAIFGPAVKAKSLPLVYYMHSPATGQHWLEWWARRTPPDLVLCNSNFTATTTDLLFPRVRAETIYCPVAPPASAAANRDRSDIRSELQIAGQATVIIQVSRMESWKGHAQHLEALSRLTDLPDWVGWFVGGAQRAFESEYLSELKRLAAQLGIAERVRFLDQRSDVPRLLAAADIFCQPNTSPEPFGIAFIEALYARLPVVSTNIGGASEIVNNSCGVLVPPGDPEALSQALRELIQNHAQRDALSSAGPGRAQYLSDPAKRMKQFYDALRSMISNQPLN